MSVEREIQTQQYDLDKDGFGQVVASNDINKSYPITADLNRQVKAACEQRVEKNWNYNIERINKINHNYELAESTEYSDDTSVTKMSYGSICVEVDNWADKLYGIFQGFNASLKINDPKGNLKKTFSQEFDVKEEDVRQGTFSEMIFKIFTSSGARKEFQSKVTYFFNKMELIKNLMTVLISESGVEKQSTIRQGCDNFEYFLLQGIISGMFCLIDTFEQESFIELDTGKAVVSKKSIFKFNPVDTRDLIIPNNIQMPWFAIIKRVQFSDLMASATDESGKQRDDSPYDLKRLKELSTYIRDGKVYPSVKGIKDAMAFDYPIDETETEASMRIDSMIKVYEFHYVPIVFPGDKVQTRSFITAVSFNDDVPTINCSPNLFIIGVRKTPFINRIPIHYTNFRPNFRANDPQGIGLPAHLEKLSDRLNKVSANIADLVMVSLFGIMGVDTDKMEDETALDCLTSKTVVKFKNTNGGDIRNFITSIFPDTNAIQFGMALADKIEQKIKILSRSGTSGESPKQTALTAREFEALTADMEKNQDRPAIRISKMISGWTKDAFLYSGMFRAEDMFTTSKGSRFMNEVDSQENETNSSYGIGRRINPSSTHDVEKTVRLKPEDWFVDGLDFEVTSIESKMNEKIEKAKATEAMTMINMMATDPISKQPTIFEDENGKEVVLDKYSIIKKILSAIGVYDAFKAKPEPKTQAIPSGLIPDQQPGQSPMQPPIPGQSQILIPPVMPGIQQ